MKYLKTINEYSRTIGFKHSDPEEVYRIEAICSCSGESLTKEKVETCLSKVYKIYYDPESIKVVFKKGITQLPTGQAVNVDAEISFNIKVYSNSEIMSIVEELFNRLYSLYKVELVDFRYKRIILD